MERGANNVGKTNGARKRGGLKDTLEKFADFGRTEKMALPVCPCQKKIKQQEISSVLSVKNWEWPSRWMIW